MRFWLTGHGHVAVSNSGQKLVRSVFDSAMAQPARLDFVGGAVCHPPLRQNRGPASILSNGGFLDTRTALPDLNVEELQKYQSLVADAKANAEPEAEAVRGRWTATRAVSGIASLVKAGVEPKLAAERTKQTLSSALAGWLMGDFPITLDDQKMVTIGEVLDDRQRYHGRLTLDPLEPEYLDKKVVGKFYLLGAAPTLHSFAHGGKTFRLRRQPARLYLQKGRKAELADSIHELLAREPDIFLRGGTLVKVTDGRLTPLRKAGLAHLIGTRAALFSTNAKGEQHAVDLPSDVIDMVLELVEG